MTSSPKIPTQWQRSLPRPQGQSGTLRHRTVRNTLVCLGGVALVTGAAACSGNDNDDAAEKDFTYVLNRPLASTNAASTLGAATDAAKISARIYPGAFLPGPGNRLLPNTDLVTATPVLDNPDAVDYTISGTANYSDGAPVVCDDFLLTWVAAHRNDLFASDPGLMTRVRDLTCAAGEKTFRVDFDRGMGGRYRELFGPGEVLPSHTVIANAANAANAADGEGSTQSGEVEIPTSVVDAVNTGSDAVLSALAQSWNATFALGTTDPATVPSYGPFRIESRDDDGGLLLVANPEWRGDRPGIDRIRLRSGGDVPAVSPTTAENADTEDNADRPDVIDADVRVGQPADADLTSAGYTVNHETGVRVDNLELSTTGIFATADARRGFASCIDRPALVAAVAQATGTDASTVKSVPFRVAVPDSPAAEALGDVAARNSARDTAVTTAEIGGATVRIGYLADQPRYEAIIASLTASCETGGVSVVGVPLDATALSSPEALGTDVDAMLNTRTPYGRLPSATVSPVSAEVTVSQIRTAENELAESALTVPLTAEPRFVVSEAHVSDVSDSGTDSGLSWNMDRWVSTDHPSTITPEATNAAAVKEN